MLEPEDAGGPRGVSGWPCRIAETGSRSAPRRGGRFQPADRAAQCNAAPPPCSAPVHPRPEPAHRHHKLGLSGAKNHRPHRVERRPGCQVPRRHRQRPSGRQPVGPFRRCCRPSPVSLVLATWTEDCVAGLTATRYVGEPGPESAHLGINRWLRSLPERVRGRCRMPGSSRNGYADCRRAGANGPTIHAATRRCTSSSEHCPRPRCSP